jgi:hypothetical protein
MLFYIGLLSLKIRGHTHNRLIRNEKVGCSIHLSGTKKKAKPAIRLVAGFFMVGASKK